MPWIPDIELKISRLDQGLQDKVASCMPLRKLLIADQVTFLDCWHLLPLKEINDDDSSAYHTKDLSCPCLPIVLHQNPLDGTSWILHNRLCKQG